MLVCESALYSVGIVAQVILFFICCPGIVLGSIDGIRIWLEKCRCEVADGRRAKVGVVEGEQVMLMKG